MLASIFSSSLLLPKTSGPSEGENQFKLPPGTGTPYELVHFLKLTVFHCLLRETLLCLTESIQSTQMMESLSVSGFKKFSFGWTESDLYGLGYAYSSLTAHAGSFFICYVVLLDHWHNMAQVHNMAQILWILEDKHIQGYLAAMMNWCRAFGLSILPHYLQGTH